MTVSELIEELKKYPPDMQTVVKGSEEYLYLATNVYELRLFSKDPGMYSFVTDLENDKKTRMLFLG